MTVLTALARAAAATAGRALPTKTVRHVHLSGRPLVLVAAQLAGEACAPLAVLAGDDREKPSLLVVYEPRDRTQRFEFAADLAAIVLPTSIATPATGTSERRRRPTPASAPSPTRTPRSSSCPTCPTWRFLRLLGRSTRFRRTEGEYAVPAAVPLLGRWLTYYAERAEVAPSALLLPMTAALADHWATGQSAAEDANLAALLGWIDPPDGMTGHAAARAAEDPVRCPPAGPVTDPTFDNEVLAPILQAMREATLTGDGARLGRARAAMDHALRSQLEPTWALMWRAVDLLGGLPAAAHVEQRWLSDRRSFTQPGRVDPRRAAPRRPAGTARSRRPGGWPGLSASSSGSRSSAPTTTRLSWPSTG